MVSILIFVEIVLEERNNFQNLQNGTSFNPYFRGDSSARRSLAMNSIQELRFNPYFRGDSSGSALTDNSVA